MGIPLSPLALLGRLVMSVGGLCQGRPGRMDWSWCPSRCSPGA